MWILACLVRKTLWDCDPGRSLYGAVVSQLLPLIQINTSSCPNTEVRPPVAPRTGESDRPGIGLCCPGTTTADGVKDTALR